MKIEIPDNIAKLIFGLMYVEVCAIIGALLGWGIGELVIKIVG